eukprot:m.37782 g.37782  ORF g.37782 m.37782 type:complete len:137 (-) comp12546_c0_seq4:9-419(-)
MSRKASPTTVHSGCLLTCCCEQMTSYFCGTAQACQRNNIHKLRLALQHMKQEYLAVGVLERHAETMRLFRSLLPGHFGAYPATGHSEVRVNSNPNRTSPVAVDVREKLLTVGLDHQLYAAAVKLFEEKLASVVNPS